jgi:hypothetical protein
MPIPPDRVIYQTALPSLSKATAYTAQSDQIGITSVKNQSQKSDLSYGPDGVSALNNEFWDGFKYTCLCLSVMLR